MKIAPEKTAGLALVLALAVAAPLSGCAAEGSGAGGQAGQSQANDSNSNGDGEGSKEEAKQADSEGESDSGTDDELPGWVTKFYPIYPGSDVSTVSEGHGSAGPDRLIIGTNANDADGQKVIDWYTEQYSQNGWTIGMTQNDGARFNTEHEDGYNGVIGITEVSTATIVTLTVVEPAGA